MRQTKKVKAFLQRECKRYCRQISLSPIPTLIYNDKDMKKTVYDNNEYNNIKESALGFSIKNENLIYFNLKNTDVIAQLLDTLVHELIHLRWPKSDHNSDRFYNKINGIMMGDRY
jgi:hypothetical protein